MNKNCENNETSQLMRLRDAVWADMALLFRWVNDPTVRAASFNTANIPEGEHAEWLRAKLNSGDTKIYIFEIDGTPAGQVRMDRVNKGDAFEIDFSLDAAFRQKGLGSELLRLGVTVHSKSIKGNLQYLGSVKSDNIPSQRAFTKAGFSESEVFEDRMVFKKNVLGN